MANYTVDPVTGILIPTPGVDPGQDYATNISNALQTLAHLTHTGASNSDGYQIPAAGINFNADISAQSNNLTGLRSTRFVSQSGTLSGPGDVDCLYVDSGNLWFNNGSGTAVQVTAGSVVQVISSNNYSINAITSNLTISSGASYVIVNVDSTGGAVTVTLPSASAVPGGRFYYVKDIAGQATTHNITVRTGGDTMDGGSSYVMTSPYQAAGFVGDGVSNWAVWPFRKTTYENSEVLAFNSSSALQLNNSSSLTAGSSTSISTSGSLSSTGAITINPGSHSGTITLGSATTLTANNGSVIALGSGSNMNAASGANINMNSGSFLNLNSSSEMVATSSIIALTGGTLLSTSGSGNFITTGSGSTCQVSSGATLQVHGTHYTDTWSQWNTPKSRNMIQYISGYQVVSGSWLGGVQFTYSNATGSSLSQPMYRSHNGAGLVSVTVPISVGQSHSGVPGTLPSISVLRYAYSGLFSAQALSGVDPQYFPTPGSGSAYYDSGNWQYTLTYTCSQNNLIDNTQYAYFILITDESGTNSHPLNAYGPAQLVFADIVDTSWNT